MLAIRKLAMRPELMCRVFALANARRSIQSAIRSAQLLVAAFADKILGAPAGLDGGAVDQLASVVAGRGFGAPALLVTRQVAFATVACCESGLKHETLNLR